MEGSQAIAPPFCYFRALKQLLLDLAEAHLKEMEKKGLLPKGKGVG